VDKNFDLQDCAYLMDALMRGLGYREYIAQGGDLGAFISRLLGTGDYPSCVGVHVNFVWLLARPELAPMSSLDKSEKAGLQRADEFRTTGAAYAMEHATRPSTISHVLSSSPLALLAWIGEKFLTWTDAPHPDVGCIVEMVALWWLTNTPATAIWAYRDIFLPERLVWWNQVLPGERLHIAVPLGFSAFPKELTPVPEVWAKRTGNLVFYRSHKVVSWMVLVVDEQLLIVCEQGGHFPALEQPEKLAKDINDFVNIVEQGPKIRARL
jgi:microsomal epoxide hydrolase